MYGDCAILRGESWGVLKESSLLRPRAKVLGVLIMIILSLCGLLFGFMAEN